MAQKKNKSISKYINVSKNLMPFYGKKEANYLKRLKNQMENAEDLLPSDSFNQICEKYGTPQELVYEYISIIDFSTIERKASNKKIIVFLIVFLCITSSIVFMALGMIFFKARESVKREREVFILYEKERTEDISYGKN